MFNAARAVPGAAVGLGVVDAATEDGVLGGAGELSAWLEGEPGGVWLRLGDVVGLAGVAQPDSAISPARARANPPQMTEGPAGLAARGLTRPVSLMMVPNCSAPVDPIRPTLDGGSDRLTQRAVVPL